MVIHEFSPYLQKKFLLLFINEHIVLLYNFSLTLLNIYARNHKSKIKTFTRTEKNASENSPLNDVFNRIMHKYISNLLKTCVEKCVCFFNYNYHFNCYCDVQFCHQPRYVLKLEHAKQSRNNNT